MIKNNKKGITLTSIVVYVLLFFLFTSITITISSRLNKDLFMDRGTAINITAINKLEYNLLKSAEESYLVTKTIDADKTSINFSNNDVYVFDLENNTIYKNGGILLKFLKECNVTAQSNTIELSLILNKYTNEVQRTIKVNVNTVE